MQSLKLNTVPGPARYTTRLLHDSPALRLVEFALANGQSVKPHASPATVTLVVMEGCASFLGAGGWDDLPAGAACIFEPDEVHAIEARAGACRFLAIITPGPNAG